MRRPTRHAVLALIVALGAGALATPPARADAPPALDQYVPSLPSADGTRLPVGPATAGGSAGGLSALARGRLAREPDAALLRRIATSSALGAPPASARAGAGRRGQAPAPTGDAGSALGGALTGGTGVALLAGLGVLALTALALARSRRRR
jgi:hypothetical protein